MNVLPSDDVLSLRDNWYNNSFGVALTKVGILHMLLKTTVAAAETGNSKGSYVRGRGLFL